MYSPESSTDPEMFYQRSTEKEMATRKPPQSREQTCVGICVVANMGLLLYKASWVWPLQTPHSDLFILSLTRCLFSSQIQNTRTEEDNPLQFYGLRKAFHPFCVLTIKDLWPQRGVLNTCHIHLRKQFWHVTTRDG